MFWGNDEGDCFWRILERQRRVMADGRWQLIFKRDKMLKLSLNYIIIKIYNSSIFPFFLLTAICHLPSVIVLQILNDECGLSV